jgi:hypothetical protein
MDGPFPNFFILGAPKCGTTSLHQYVGEHPDAFMSAMKEPHYFSRAAVPDDPRPVANPMLPGASLTTFQQYRDLFADAGAAKVIGESSTGYLHSRTALENLHAAVPDARVVAMLRQPGDRAFSAYGAALGQGREALSFAETTTAEIERREASDGQRRYYLTEGYYADALSRYLDRFGSEQMRVYLFEDLIADPDAIVRDVFAFLSLDDGFMPDTGTHWNATPPPIRSPLIYRTWEREWVRNAANRLVPKSMLARMKQAARSDETPNYPESVREQLNELYASDIHRVEELLGRDLSAWLS